MAAGYTSKPVKYKHGNNNLPLVDDFDYKVGAIVQNEADLYNIPAGKINIGGLVYVEALEVHYKLIDKTNINDAAGWEEFTAGGGILKVANSNYLTNNTLLPDDDIYAGIIVYVTDANKHYTWNGNTRTNLDNWIEIAKKSDLTNKVDKVTGKGLSQENFTSTYKTSLDNLSTDLDNKLDAGTYTGNAQDLKNSINAITTYTSTDFTTDFNNKTTDDLIEGTTNKYNKPTDWNDIPNKPNLKIKRTNKTITGIGYTILESDKNKFLVFTQLCNCVIPNGLSADLEFQGVGDIVVNVESGGTLNYSGAFINETFDANSFFGIRTMGGNVSQLTGTLKLA